MNKYDEYTINKRLNSLEFDVKHLKKMKNEPQFSAQNDNVFVNPSERTLDEWADLLLEAYQFKSGPEAVGILRMVQFYKEHSSNSKKELVADGDDYQTTILSNIRCPICGDSKLDPDKKRGYFILHNGEKRYRCFNRDCLASTDNTDAMLTYKQFMLTALKENGISYAIDDDALDDVRNLLSDKGIYIVPREPNDEDVRAFIERIKNEIKGKK